MSAKSTVTLLAGPALGGVGPNWEQFRSAQVPNQLAPSPMSVEFGAGPNWEQLVAFNIYIYNIEYIFSGPLVADPEKTIWGANNISKIYGGEDRPLVTTLRSATGTVNYIIMPIRTLL